jgi:hypothetical protein
MPMRNKNHSPKSGINFDVEKVIGKIDQSKPSTKFLFFGVNLTFLVWLTLVFILTR